MSEDCVYCGCEVSEPGRVPAVDDDEGWADVAEEHSDGCEWVATRAHRRREGEVDR